MSQAGAGNRSGASVGNAWSLEQFNASTSPGGGDNGYFSGTFANTVTPSSGGSGNGARRLTLSFGNATLTADPGLSVVGQAYLNLEGGTIKGANASGISFGGQASHDVTVTSWMFNGKDISANYCMNLVVADNTVMSSGGFIFGDSTANHDLNLSSRAATSTGSGDGGAARGSRFAPPQPPMTATRRRGIVRALIVSRPMGTSRR